MDNNRYIITGSPGTGKTTLVNVLASVGYKTSSEVAYKIVEKNLSLGNNNLPWGNRVAFDAEVFVLMLNNYFQDERNKPIFYDGGIPDIIAWEDCLGFDYTNYTKFVDLFRYEPTVFIPEPWEEIYVRDAVRNFSFADSLKVYESIKRFYHMYGYKVVSLPKETTPKERVNIIMNHINHYDGPSV